MITRCVFILFLLCCGKADASLPPRRVQSTSGGALNGLGLTYNYDGWGRRFSMSLNTLPNALSVSYGYDSASRLTNVTYGSFSAGYTYLANSPLVSQVVFREGTTNRLTVGKMFDKLNRLQSITASPGGAGQPPISFGGQYTDVNDCNRVNLPDGSYWLYEYDPLGQVKSGKKYFADSTPVPGQQFEYAHDEIGNRTSAKAGGDQYGQNLRSSTYGNNVVNQHTNRTVYGALDVMGAAISTNGVTVNRAVAQYRKGEYFRHELAVNNAGTDPAVTGVSVESGATTVLGKMILPPATQSFRYDADGNLTNDLVWSYTWDGENRLIQMVSAPGMASTNRLMLAFEYDWAGRRIRKTVTRLDNSAVVLDDKFVYDGWNLIAEINGTNNTVIRSYAWGLDLSGSQQGAGGVGGLLMVSDTALGTHFPAYDLNGNVAALVNASTGTNSALYGYSPFGEVIRATGPMAKLNPFRFSTKYQDDETDLVYYGRRYLNTSTGRWLSRDPIGEKGGLNLYGLVGNNPIVRIDKLGLRSVCELKIIVGHFSNTTLPHYENTDWSKVPAGNGFGYIGCGANTLHMWMRKANPDALIPGMPKNNDDELPTGKLKEFMDSHGLPPEDLANPDEIPSKIDTAFQSAKMAASSKCSTCCCSAVRVSVSCDQDTTEAEKVYGVGRAKRCNMSTVLDCSSKNWSMMH